jgi:hypothetical protein
MIRRGDRLSELCFQRVDPLRGAQAGAGYEHGVDGGVPTELEHGVLDRPGVDPCDLVVVLVVERAHHRHLDAALDDVVAHHGVDAGDVRREQRHAP